MKTQVFTPFLPSWEYIPDVEPHVFDGRLYLYGSHDRFGGEKFCLNNYVVWSAPLDDLSDWRFGGEIYAKTQDPDNPDGALEMWAPDVARGPDGRYYLYYCLGDYPKISVAVCDEPDGRFEFLGHVQDANGNAIGTREGDTLPFDPAVLVDDDQRVWLYAGNGPFEFLPGDQSNKASVSMELQPDMLTVKAGPKPLIPLQANSAGTGFEGHEFFEASSIRKFGGRYYFIYSSIQVHELCYAVSDRPDGDFRYGGTLVSNGDIDPADGVRSGFRMQASPLVRNYIGNNHGSLVQVDGRFYIFFHRQTNRTMFSRQACAEEIKMRPDGNFEQARLTCHGLNGGPLACKGRYEARIACHLYSKNGALFGDPHQVCQTQRSADRIETIREDVQANGAEQV